MKLLYVDREYGLSHILNHFRSVTRFICLSAILSFCSSAAHAVNTDGLDLACSWKANEAGQNHFIVEIQRTRIDSESDSIFVEKDYTKDTEYHFSVENGFNYSIYVQEVSPYGCLSDNSEKLSFSVQDNEIICSDADSQNPRSTISLLSNYPNPFNPITTISYSLPQDDHVKLCIYNVIGQEVIRLVEDYQVAGAYQAKWIADQMPSGIYFYRIETSTMSETRKMMLLK